MKKYTTDEVIALVSKWIKEQTDNVIAYNTFPKWLKEKEQSELPVKDQLIWVKNKTMVTWIKRIFVKLDDNGNVMCYYQHNKNIFYDEAFTSWDEYSLTDPNQ